MQKSGWQNTSSIHVKIINKLGKKETSSTWWRTVTTNFTREVSWMADRYMKRGSTSLIIRKMKIRSTMRYYYTLVRMAKVKRTDINQHWQGHEQLELSYTVGGNAKWYTTLQQFSRYLFTYLFKPLFKSFKYNYHMIQPLHSYEFI